MQSIRKNRHLRKGDMKHLDKTKICLDILSCKEFTKQVEDHSLMLL